MRRSTKNAFLSSIVALILCVSMLIGTTYAWFTDSVTSANNIIATGNLDVELYWHDGNDWVEVNSSTNVFMDGALWEPGHTEIVNLKVVNAGSLGLKYKLSVGVAEEKTAVTKDGETIKLSDIVRYGAFEENKTYATRDEAVADAENNTVTAPLSAGYVFESDLENKGNTEYVTMVVYMPSSVGNEANYKGEAPTLSLGVTLSATQLAYEGDSFGNDYDAVAPYPASDAVSIPANMTESKYVSANGVSVEIPVGSDGGEYTLHVTNNTVESGKFVYDITLLKDDAEAPDTGYTIILNIGTLLTDVEVFHNGVKVDQNSFNYDAMTGLIYIDTNTFSPFEIVYEELNAPDIEIEDNKIVGGTFEGVDPGTLDKSLLADDSEYCVIPYVKGGVQCYVVSEKANTVVFAAPDTEYTPDPAYADGFEVTTLANNGLASAISALQSREFTNVYLLPGTYNASSTVYVYSSMDIVGLGDKSDIKIIKQSSSDSNRHLLNCTGTKEDYIYVTIRNLHLDASAKTTGGKDNAAVQSIRRTKVKCYDLEVVKEATGFGAYAFYANGRNKVGTEVAAGYLYIENTVVYTKGSSNVMDMMPGGDSKIYYSGLTYVDNNGVTYAYTSTGSAVKNKAMEAEDWIWD